MRYFLADIIEDNGEFEFNTTTRFKLDDNRDPREAHERIAAS